MEHQRSEGGRHNLGPNEEDAPVPAEFPERQARAERLVLQVARFLSKMDPTRPDIVRAVAARHALKVFGRIFWKRPLAETYDLSFVTESIGEFWSHSWQFSPVRKIFTLLLLKNGLMAAVLGSVGALAGCLLSIFHILPVGEAEPPRGLWYYPARSMWSFGLGSGLFLLTLLAWPSQASIFLDRICIHQSDPRLKMEGVMSIGAFLKRSERMLVLWDASYMQRLWCVFEVAAFLKSRSADQEAHLQIVPVHMGSFCLVFGMAGASVYVIVWIVFMHGVVGWEILVLLPIIMTPAGLYAIADARAYMRSVHTLQEQLASFSLRNSRCSCCDWNHVRNGTPVPCDRDAIGHCIGEWFGAEAEFEHAIHSVVLPAFTSRFGEHLVPFRIFLVATVPLFWGMMDLVAGYAISERGREEGGTVSLWWLFAGFGTWLGVLPASCVWILALTRRLRASRGRILNAAVNLLIFALAAPALCFMLGLQIAVRDLADLVLGGDLATHLLPLWAGIGSSLQISIALLSWNFAKLRRLRAKP